MKDFDTAWLLSRMQKERIQKCSPNESAITSDAVEVESDLHDQIIGECRRRGWPFVHSRMDKATGQAAGIPDFVIATNLPIIELRTLWVECKSVKGKQSPAQRGFQMMLEMNAHSYHLICSFSEFLKLITIKLPFPP